MNTKNIFLVTLFLVINWSVIAQKSAIYTDELATYNQAIDLYLDKDYVAAKQIFQEIISRFDANSARKANCAYYIAFSSLYSNDGNGNLLIQDFVINYPVSSKVNEAYREVSAYYYDYGKYSDALKWFKKVDKRGMSNSQEEEFNFKYGYALFSLKKYKKATTYFAPLLESEKYGTQAKYYSGYIAMQNKDYENADKLLDQVDDRELGKDIPYFKASIKFKIGEFQKAIDIAEPYLENANRKQKSDVAKIIGESYFNLKQYGKAIPYLIQYRGKHGKWINTDYYQLGFAYYKQKEYEKAITKFNKIISSKSAIGQNASYHLAECYVKSNKKQEALNAYRNALEMDYSSGIKKNAWLNYAKLSYEIGNSLKSVPDVLTAYIEKYPNSEEVNEINELLVSSYVTSKNYMGAMLLLENKKEEKSKEIYQKVAFYRGVQLFNDSKYNKALEIFNKSLQKQVSPVITAKTTYWKAETNYILNRYEEAKRGFESFKAMEVAKETLEIKSIAYNIAYSNFKLKNYKNAIISFNNFLETSSKISTQKKDSYLRLGDSYFITRDYYKGMEAYNLAIKHGSKQLDYAYFQKGISYGFVGKNNSKIETLNSFLQKFPKSKYRDEAYYSLGTAYTKSGKTMKAIESFGAVLQFNKSKLKPKALLKQGLIYFNSNKGENALVKYKKLVKEYPQSAESRQAVNNARQIYINLGQVQEYANWVQSVDFVEVTDTELDNTMFESADIQYQQNNKSKAIIGFDKYLERFPNGLHALQTNFYLAEMHYSANKFGETKKYYTYIINQNPNEYTEQALTRLSQVLLNDKNWEEAIPVLKRLENEAKNEQNILYAQSNLMKGNYNIENYGNSVVYADKILSQPNLTDDIKTDAKIIIARAAIKTKKMDKAKAAYQEVFLIAQGELKAESIYYDAFFKHRDKNYEESKALVFKLAADYSTYKVWSVKGLVILAKDFYALNDAFQAIVVLESIIKNYKNSEIHSEAVLEGEKTLQTIKNKEAETNASVIAE